MRKTFLTGNGLETACTCLYDVGRCQEGVQHCEESPRPNSGPNYGPKTAPYRKGWKLRQLRPDFRQGYGLVVSIEVGEGSARLVEHGRSRNLVSGRPQGCWIHVKTFGYIDVKKM